MSSDDWVRFLGTNSAFVAVLIVIALFWLRAFRRSDRSREVVSAVAIAAILGGTMATLSWLQQPPPPLGTPDFVWPWGLAMTVGLLASLFALLALLFSTALLGYRRMRSGR